MACPGLGALGWVGTWEKCNENVGLKQGCQFSDLTLISDFLRIKETGIKLIRYCKNMDKVLTVFKDRLDSGKRLESSLKAVSKH